MSQLRIERLPLARGLEVAGSGAALLGAMGYGTPDDSDWMATVDAPVLSPGGPMADLWHSNGPVRSGSTGRVRWRTDGQWTLGAIDVDESVDDRGLAEATQRAYDELFAALADAQTPHLLRIWNYLPLINADGGGLERYRQFNLGRQDSFLAAGRAVFDGAPAACALGIHRGALGIRFLAGCTPATPFENPRQVSAYRYPSVYGPRAPTFSRAALAGLGGTDLALFISGTASIVGHETRHLNDVVAQAHETLRNLEAVVDAACARATASFTVAGLDGVVYVRHSQDLPAVREVIERTLGAQSHFVRHAVYLQADICRSDLLVEIEAHAVAAGRLHA